MSASLQITLQITLDLPGVFSRNQTIFLSSLGKMHSDKNMNNIKTNKSKIYL